MKIVSTAFPESGLIPQKYTCEGENIFPPLQIFDPPEKTKSFAIIMHDHDAKGGDFAHWLIWNIDGKVRALMKEAAPSGAFEGINDMGNLGWSGPCPPAGTGEHRYEFHLYALDTMLDLLPSSKKEDLREAIKDHTLKEASLMGLYKKS